MTPASYVDACKAVSGADEKEAKLILGVLGKAENAPLLSSFHRICMEIRRWPRTGPILKIAYYVESQAEVS